MEPVLKRLACAEQKLERVEADITADLQALEEAFFVEKPEEYIDIIKKDIQRMMDEKVFWVQALLELLLQLATATGAASAALHWCVNFQGSVFPTPWLCQQADGRN